MWSGVEDTVRLELFTNGIVEIRLGKSDFLLGLMKNYIKKRKTLSYMNEDSSGIKFRNQTNQTNYGQAHVAQNYKND